MNRELRRFYAERAKTRIVKHTLYPRWIDVNDAVHVGILAKTPARCSRGGCCGNPRRYRKEVTIQELKQLDSYKDFLKDLGI